MGATIGCYFHFVPGEGIVVKKIPAV